MSKKRNKTRPASNQQANQNKPQRTRSNVGILTGDALLESLAVSGYTPLDHNPEIIAGCRAISNLISSMTIYLMSNTDKGDQRIINELSRKVDINPWSLATRKSWMDAIVMNLLLYGDGNSVVLPKTEGGNLADLIPVPASNVTFRALQDGTYKVRIGGAEFDPSDVLHFVNNPDKNYLWKGQGYRVALRDVAYNITQARETEKGFMQSKWKPSIIVKVDGMIDEFSSPEGRKKLLSEYADTNEAGEPWLIPADQFQVDTIKPLSLSDLAINDTVKIDKSTVASILGVPAFALGEGSYTSDEWNNFINSTIRPIVEEIEQELTKKLLISPKWFFKFNLRSLYSYDLATLSSVAGEMTNRGIMTGNEARGWLNLSPKDGLDELQVLENYIPLEDIGNQKKLDNKGDE